MSCPNCHLFKSKCGAECCSVVPLPRSLYFANIDKVFREVGQVMDIEGGYVIPMTLDMKCPFLTEDLGCAIYEDRPPICRKFGDESLIHMTCAYQSKEGNPRTKKEFRKINEQQLKQQNQFLKL